MNILKINRGPVPTKPGRYFCQARHSNFVELVTVSTYPATNYGGLEFPARLCVPAWGNKSPGCLDGFWSEEVFLDLVYSTKGLGV